MSYSIVPLILFLHYGYGNDCYRQMSLLDEKSINIFHCVCFHVELKRIKPWQKWTELITYMTCMNFFVYPKARSRWKLNNEMFPSQTPLCVWILSPSATCTNFQWNNTNNLRLGLFDVPNVNSVDTWWFIPVQCIIRVSPVRRVAHTT